MNSIIIIRPASMLQEKDLFYMAGSSPAIGTIQRIDKGEFITIFYRYPVKSQSGQVIETREGSFDLSRFDSLQIIKEIY